MQTVIALQENSSEQEVSFKSSSEVYRHTIDTHKSGEFRDFNNGRTEKFTDTFYAEGKKKQEQILHCRMLLGSSWKVHVEFLAAELSSNKHIQDRVKKEEKEGSNRSFVTDVSERLNCDAEEDTEMINEEEVLVSRENGRERIISLNLVAGYAVD